MFIRRFNPPIRCGESIIGKIVYFHFVLQISKYWGIAIIQQKRLGECPLCNKPSPNNEVHKECSDRENYLASKENN